MTTRSPDAPASSVAFIGGGNMARSLIGGLVAAGTDPGMIRHLKSLLGGLIAAIAVFLWPALGIPAEDGDE